MARLIEVQNVHDVRAPISLQVGDVLQFNASGGHVQTERKVVEMIGAFVPAVLGENSDVVTAMGTPNTVLVRALRPGIATIDVVTSDPWRAPQMTTIKIEVISPGKKDLRL